MISLLKFHELPNLIDCRIVGLTVVQRSIWERDDTFYLYANQDTIQFSFPPREWKW